MDKIDNKDFLDDTYNAFYIFHPNKLGDEFRNKTGEHYIARRIADVQDFHVFVGAIPREMNGGTYYEPFVKILHHDELESLSVVFDTALYGLLPVNKVYKNKEVLFENHNTGLLIAKDFGGSIETSKFYYEYDASKIKEINIENKNPDETDLEYVIDTMLEESGLVDDDLITTYLYEAIESYNAIINQFNEAFRKKQEYFDLVAKNYIMHATPSLLFPFIYKQDIKQFTSDSSWEKTIKKYNEVAVKKINKDKNGKYRYSNSELKELVLAHVADKINEAYRIGEKVINDDYEDLYYETLEYADQADILVTATEAFTKAVEMLKQSENELVLEKK